MTVYVSGLLKISKMAFRLLTFFQIFAQNGTATFLHQVLQVQRHLSSNINQPTPCQPVCSLQICLVFRVQAVYCTLLWPEGTIDTVGQVGL